MSKEPTKTWEDVVFECEKILGLEGHADEPMISNLPNAVRDLKAGSPSLPVDVDVMAQISILCKDAIYTDGGHHKQWYLSEILKLIEPDTYKMLKEKDADLGIAP